MKRWVLGALLAVICVAGSALPFPGRCPGEPHALHVPRNPSAVPRGDAFWVAYELLAPSRGSDCGRFAEVRVLDGDTRAELAVVSVDDPVGVDGAPRGIAKRIYIDLALPGSPRRLRHRYRFLAADGSALDAEGPTVDVAPPEALKVLGPPVSGGPWIAVYDPALPRGHRRYVYVEDGAERIPGRHAIDWFATDADGRLHAGGGDRLEQWHGFGLPVRAVDAGEVVAVRDQDADRPPNSAFGEGPGTGNLVVLRLAEGVYAFYEHLRRGSIRVRVGDKVTKGQVLGELGNSGHSMTPHLHFHLADGPRPLGSEGIPYLLEGATTVGCHPSLQAALSGGQWRECPRAPSPTGRRFPLPNQVVRFPD